MSIYLQYATLSRSESMCMYECECQREGVRVCVLEVLIDLAGACVKVTARECYCSRKKDTK